MDALEKKLGKNFAASSDVTSNPEKGGDWVLETDNIDVSAVYFKKEAIANYVGCFGGTAKGWKRGGPTGKKRGGGGKSDEELLKGLFG